MKLNLLYIVVIFFNCLNVSVNRKLSNTSRNPFKSNKSKTEILNKRCGISRNSGSAQRILGGRYANIGEFPWQVSLHKSGWFRCGGVIIDTKTVLTAAHCVQGNSPNLLKIRYNRINRSEDGFEMNVLKAIIHPNYDNRTLDNDLAILQLAKRLSLNKINSGTICLPSKKQNTSDGDMMTITGWGLTDNFRDSNSLKAIEIPIISLTTCRKQYSSLPVVFTITDNMICAGLVDGGEDACNGDSGGPMIQSIGDSVFVLIGIVSKGYGCALPNRPGVYTHVPKYIDWINDHKL